jgi:hypothetical protein
MPRSKVLPEILRLDPEKENQRIVFLTCRCDFPFDTTRALEFALFRTFCVPSIGGLLDKTKEFGERSQKRYDDTDIVVSEIMEHGYDSERGAKAIARMNEIHGRFKISNQDYLYVLSTFIYEPIRWNVSFGWRRLYRTERTAMFYFWRAVGERMNIQDLPTSYEAFESFNRQYELHHFQPNPGSKRVSAATMKMFAGWAPWPLRGIVPKMMCALMDEALLDALELPSPTLRTRAIVAALLRFRGAVSQTFTPRANPKLRTKMSRRTYPQGYTLEGVGPKAG